MSIISRRMRAYKAIAEQSGQTWQEAARNDIARQIQLWKHGAHRVDGMAWIEKPADFGLRLVGYADEICSSNYAYRHGIEHTGWWTDDDGLNETIRGVVYQFPAKNGRARYVAGYADPYNDGPARLDLSEIFESAPRIEQDCPSYCAAARHAARCANSIAERDAEKERDYNRAWNAGQDAARYREEAATTRRELIEALAEHRQERDREAERPKLCALFRKWVGEQVEYIRDQQTNARELMDNYAGNDSFREGLEAGI